MLGIVDTGVSIKIGCCYPEASSRRGFMPGRRIGESFGTIARKGVVTSWARLALNATTLTELLLTLLLTLPLILEEGRPCGM